MSEPTALGPSEIFAEIEARPPVMRAQAKAAHLGREADWALLFADGYEEASGTVRLMFHYRPHEIKYVVARVPLADYPWIKSMRSGDAVQVHGCIAEIGNLGIELTAVTLMQLVEAGR